MYNFLLFGYFQSFQSSFSSSSKYNLIIIIFVLHMQKQNNTQPDQDQQYQSSSDYSDDYKPPEKNQTNNQIFKKYKDSKIISQQSQDNNQQYSFQIKDLDTGEIVVIDNQQSRLKFDEKISYKRKIIKGISKFPIWATFWKIVHKNSEQLRAYAEKGEFQKLKQLVMYGKNQYPVQINSKGFDDWTALHYASYEGYADIVQFLLDNDSHINAKTKFNQTALHISAVRGHLDVIEILCKNKIDIDHQDNQGNTALHVASENSQVQVIQYLLKFTQVLKKNNDGLTAIDVAPNQVTKDIFFQYGFKESQKLDQLLLKRVNSKASQYASSQLKTNYIHRIKLPEEQLSPNSFIYYRQLGKGSFGEVFLVSKKGQQRFHAMKVLSKDKIFGKNLVRYAMAERNVLSAMDHPFIVKLNYAFQTQTKLFLVMDYCPGGDLGKVIGRRKQLPESEVRFYISELVLAFQALHKNMIIFRDLKPDNVVLDEEGHARLTDFGLSKQGVYNNTTESFCGSIAYLAPEILNKQGHSRTVDWYLLGLLIYELLVGIPPYYNAKKQILFENIKRGPLKIPKTMSSNAKDLIKRLLCRDPRKRLGANKDAEQIKQHPFFESINWKDVLNKKLPIPSIQIPKININQTIKVHFNQQSSEGGKRIQDWTFVKSN